MGIKLSLQALQKCGKAGHSKRKGNKIVMAYRLADALGI
jgi:hypothetical protein